ncbi:unnamed protein product [Fusarium graminearum]|uniref:Uncharacterized protein n=1 Tax=Gibberella zeae TaxID=5518 RepID=A0A4U9F9P8_GIBZA|nr:unnamed protein product [Fusarium graminearum]CAG1982003.1 unnamed protein product [Fusarium graminearum]VTO93021.1 unnamed protein product [Fusarium graminearum]
MQIWFMANRTKGQRFMVVSTVPKTAFGTFIPRRGYLVFEIMDDHRAHENAWFGVPTVGPFQNFELASCFAARVEWLDEPSAEWRSLPLAPCKHKGRAVKGLLDGWRKAASIVQLLEGITWTEPHNGSETLSFGAMEVRELKIDPLQQTCRWVPRKAKELQPAPVLASWDDNFKLMVGLSLYPTEQHRTLAFHNTMSLEQIHTPIRIPAPFVMQPLEVLDLEEQDDADRYTWLDSPQPRSEDDRLAWFLRKV